MDVTEKKKLLSCIAADLKMLATKTGLMEIEKCEDYISDFGSFFENNYLEEISIILIKKGTSIRVKKYRILRNISKTDDDFPGDNNWDDLNGDRLTIVISYSDTWGNLSKDDQKTIKDSMKIPWSLTKIDTTFPHLSSQADKDYTTKSMHIERYSYE